MLWLAVAPSRSAAQALTPDERDALKLAEKIDELIAARLEASGVKPAPLADDAEFLRRVYLDLVGRTPAIHFVTDFLDNKSPDKRWRLVQSILKGELKESTLARNSYYVDHFANVWRSVWLPQYSDPNLRGIGVGFENWLRSRLAANTPYDQMVREIVTAAAFGRGDGSLTAFYQAAEFRPENVAAATSRLFLGVKLECAQCHDHPFAKWSRNQFWEYAAFFAGVSRQGRTGDPREIKIAGTDKVVKARFLDGAEPKWKDGGDARATLAEWMTAADNPFFARNGANRLWEYFFGIGLIEPVDEPSDDNPPSHPELLDELARQFAEHKYDLKFLIRAITMSKTYQRTSALTDPGQADQRLFARMAVRGMSPEQLFDSLAVATGKGESMGAGFDPNLRGPLSARADFLARFPNQDRRTETQTSILQALYFMNGRLVADATTPERNPNLATIARYSGSTARKVQELYLITLSRRPRPEETERFVKYIESGGPAGDPTKALTDVFWALLNSTEFYFNH
jgi:hypothetical protein